MGEAGFRSWLLKQVEGEGKSVTAPLRSAVMPKRLVRVVRCNDQMGGKKADGLPHTGPGQASRRPGYGNGTTMSAERARWGWSIARRAHCAHGYLSPLSTIVSSPRTLATRLDCFRPPPGRGCTLRIDAASPHASPPRRDPTENPPKTPANMLYSAKCFA
jgi:hypothetical protein